MIYFIKMLQDAFGLLFTDQRFMAVLLGLIISLAGTQFVKFRLPWPPAWEASHRWAVRAVSLPLGLIPTWRLWPDDGHVGFYVGLAVGFGAPTAYRIVTALIYRKWPDLEARWSARPGGAEDDSR